MILDLRKDDVSNEDRRRQESLFKEVLATTYAGMYPQPSFPLYALNHIEQLELIRSVNTITSRLRLLLNWTHRLPH